MKIHCCSCNHEVKARLTKGSEVYPFISELASLPFWICDACKCFVGCHHKTDEPTKPLGSIPSDEVKKLRKQVHAMLDPLWMTGQHSRSYIYNKLSKVIGREYHTADIRNAKEAGLVKAKIKELQSISRPPKHNIDLSFLKGS